jgi:hypothetical protein
MHIREHIIIPQLDVRIAVLDVVAQSNSRPPRYLCDYNGTVQYFTERAMIGWRWTAAAWSRSGVEVEVARPVATGESTWLKDSAG